jgi:PAS domain S-box-containing protein
VSEGASHGNSFDPDPRRTLDALAVAAYVVDVHGRIRWLNRGGIELFGNIVGRSFTRIVAPDQVNLARKQLAVKLIGETPATHYPLAVIGASGRRIDVRISSVALHEDGRVVGVFGLAHPVEDGAVAQEGLRRRRRAGTPSRSALTARQSEVLALLSEGLGTLEIAERLGVAPETARNHIRALLRQLGAHSRLEAVVAGYRLGLLEPEIPDEN